MSYIKDRTINRFTLTRSCMAILISGHIAKMLSNTSLGNTSEANITTEGSQYLQIPLGVNIFLLSIQAALGVLGVVGNILVSVTVVRRTSKLSALSPYLLSLACADLGILLFNHPIVILRIQLRSRWILGKVICLYVNTFKETFFSASIWTITAIAAERYLNTSRKTKKIRLGQRKSLKKRACFIITAIWIISFGVTTIPAFIDMEYHSNNSSHSRCRSTASLTFNRIFVTVKAIILYVLPLGLIAFSYQSISKRVAKRSEALLAGTPSFSREASCSNTRAILIQTRKTQRILKPLVIVFAATMLPLQLFSLVASYWTLFNRQSYFYVFFTLVNISVAVNAAADPLVYCVVNENFRVEMKAALYGCFRCQNTKTVRERQSVVSTVTVRSRAKNNSMVLSVTNEETNL